MNFVDIGHLPEPPIDPPCLEPEDYEEQVRRADQYKTILEALDDIDDLVESLIYIDKMDPDFKLSDPMDSSLFCGYRGGKYKLFNAFEVLKIIQADLEELKTDMADMEGLV